MQHTCFHLDDINCSNKKLYTMVTNTIFEEQLNVFVRFFLHGDTLSPASHGNVVQICNGVAALLETEPRPSHHQRDGAALVAMGTCRACVS